MASAAGRPQARTTAALECFFRFPVEEERRTRDPALPLRTPNKREVLPDTLTMAELERLSPTSMARQSTWQRLHDGAPQNQSANGCLPVICTLVSTSRSKAPSSSSVDEAPVAAERQAIPCRRSSNAAWPTGWQSTCRTGRPFR